MTAALLVVVVCLFIEGFFSGSEMAIVSADRIEVRKRASRGDKTAMLLEAFYKEPERILATTLVGTNLAVVIATVVFTLAVLRAGRPEWLSVAILSPTLLTLGEIVPKTLFQQNANKIAPKVIGVLFLLSKALGPVRWVVESLSGAISRVAGLGERKALVTREELKLLLRSSAATARESEITEGERRMIGNIFEFGSTTAEDVMVPLSEVFALPLGTSLRRAAEQVAAAGHSRVPIYRERVDLIVGVLHVFDLIRAGARDGAVEDLMRPPVFVPPSQLAVEVLRLLQRERQGMAVVVDEYGGSVGIVTVEDILEEVVGEIEDEYDKFEPLPITAEAPGMWRVIGRTPIATINETLGLALPEGEDYETVAGLVLSHLRRIPRVGEQANVGPVTIEVTRASERAVEEVRIRARPK